MNDKTTYYRRCPAGCDLGERDDGNYRWNCDTCGGMAFVPVKGLIDPADIDYEAAIRQLVFDIIMHERNLSESDMDDQAEASEQVDEWMTLFAAVGEEEQ